MTKKAIKKEQPSSSQLSGKNSVQTLPSASSAMAASQILKPATSTPIISGNTPFPVLPGGPVTFIIQENPDPKAQQKNGNKMIPIQVMQSGQQNPVVLAPTMPPVSGASSQFISAQNIALPGSSSTIKTTKAPTGGAANSSSSLAASAQHMGPRIILPPSSMLTTLPQLGPCVVLPLSSLLAGSGQAGPRPILIQTSPGAQSGQSDLRPVLMTSSSITGVGGSTSVPSGPQPIFVSSSTSSSSQSIPRPILVSSGPGTTPAQAGQQAFLIPSSGISSGPRHILIPAPIGGPTPLPGPRPLKTYSGPGPMVIPSTMSIPPSIMSTIEVDPIPLQHTSLVLSETDPAFQNIATSGPSRRVGITYHPTMAELVKNAFADTNPNGISFQRIKKHIGERYNLAELLPELKAYMHYALKVGELQCINSNGGVTGTFVPRDNTESDLPSMIKIIQDALRRKELLEIPIGVLLKYARRRYRQKDIDQKLTAYIDFALISHQLVHVCGHGMNSTIRISKRNKNVLRPTLKESQAVSASANVVTSFVIPQIVSDSFSKVVSSPVVSGDTPSSSAPALSKKIEIPPSPAPSASKLPEIPKDLPVIEIFLETSEDEEPEPEPEPKKAKIEETRPRRGRPRKEETPKNIKASKKAEASKKPEATKKAETSKKTETLKKSEAAKKTEAPKRAEGSRKSSRLRMR